MHIERVRSHLAPTEWSGTYSTHSQRLVLPMSDAGIDIRAHDQTWLLDGLTAMRLSSQLTYKMRFTSQTVHESLVVCERRLDACNVELGFWLLCPRTLFRVHLAVCRGASATGLTALISDLVEQLPGANKLMPSTGAVGRARRLLIAAPEVFARASLHDIADASAVSAFHLARSFRRQTGLSLHRYHQRLRLAAVLTRMSRGERDLPGLAHDHGFCSQSHLGAVFLREVGLTPSRARLAFAERS